MAVKRVGIVGSGIMGAGIAEVAAATGHEVVLRSRSQSTADAMMAGLEKSLERQVEKGRRSEADRDDILAHVTATTSFEDLADGRPRHRVGGGGHGGQEAPLHRARPGVR